MSKTSLNWVIVRISDILESYGWSIYRLAKESDIPYSSLNNLFVRNTMPTVSTLMKICDGLNISMSDFFKEEIPEMNDLSLLSSDEKELLTKYRLLSKSDKALLSAYMSGLAKQAE